MPAARHVQRPERRVLQGHIAHGKVFDCLKQHHARAERLAEFRAFVEAVVHILVQKHLVALTVDRAHAADGHILGVAGPQKEAALPAVGGVVGVGAVPALRERGNIGGVQAADKHRAALQMQLHIVLQQHGAAQKAPGRHDNAPAARRCGRLDRLLDGCRAVGHTVCHSAVA